MGNSRLNSSIDPRTITKKSFTAARDLFTISRVFISINNGSLQSAQQMGAIKKNEREREIEKENINKMLPVGRGARCEADRMGSVRLDGTRISDRAEFGCSSNMINLK